MRSRRQTGAQTRYNGAGVHTAHGAVLLQPTSIIPPICPISGFERPCVYMCLCVCVCVCCAETRSPLSKVRKAFLRMKSSHPWVFPACVCHIHSRAVGERCRSLLANLGSFVRPRVCGSWSSTGRGQLSVSYFEKVTF